MKTFSFWWMLLVSSAIIPLQVMGQTVVLTASDTLPCIGDLVTFTLNISGGTPTKIEWDDGFGFFTELGGGLSEDFFFSVEEEVEVRARVTFGTTAIIEAITIQVAPPSVFPEFADFAASTTFGQECNVLLNLSSSVLLNFTPPSLRFGYEVFGPNGYSLNKPLAPVSFSSSGFVLNETVDIGLLYSTVFPGTYKVKFVSDYGRGCQGMDSLTFILPDTLAGVVNQTNPVLGNDGSITVSVSRGNGNSQDGYVSYQGISLNNSQLGGNQSISIPGSVTFSNLSGGQYEVIYLDDFFPCWTTRIVTLTPAVSTDPTLFDDFQVFPSPSEGIVQVQGCQMGSELEIRNPLGQLVYQQALWAPIVVLDLRHVGPGLFSVYVLGEDRQVLGTQLIQLH